MSSDLKALCPWGCLDVLHEVRVLAMCPMQQSQQSLLHVLVPEAVDYRVHCWRYHSVDHRKQPLSN